MAEKKEDPNAEPLKPDSKKPQTAVSPDQQAGANQLQDEETGAGNTSVFGDTTSSTGEANIAGYHGRDGGITSPQDGGKPHNPVADKKPGEENK